MHKLHNHLTNNATFRDKINGVPQIKTNSFELPNISLNF